MGASINAESRAQALAQMSDPAGLDVLVIGGGVTGAGIALDAASRGLRVGVVEAQDWASGTSSRSSKLVHGGLRYLQMLDFHLVHEALNERDRLLTELAPHLVRPVPFLYPLEHRVWERFYVGSGIALYDALASMSSRRRATPFHRHLSRTRLRQVFPDLRDDVAVGAIQYWDAQVDDARLVISLVRTAASHGALLANRTQVTRLTTTGGRVAGAVVVDLETGAEHTITAKAVINATGVWTEETEALAETEGGLKVLASKGVHIVVGKERIRGTRGLILQTEKSVLFVIPWERYWVIGTTDTPWQQGPQHPVATEVDIDYLLSKANEVLARPLTRDDIIGTYAGLRPLLQPGTKAGTSSAKVSREHTTASPVPGLVVIAGGKLTTYRVMAKDAVDFALGKEGAATHPSVTDRLPLIGAIGYRGARSRMAAWRRQFGWTEDQGEHLLRRYGAQVADLVSLIETQPDLAQPLAQAPAYLRAEVVWAVTREQALHLDDLLQRRTRLDYEIADGGLAAMDEICALVAPLLGWDEDRVAAEKKNCHDRREALAVAATVGPDSEAALARAAAADLVPMRVLG